jgi:pyruvate dehydrogenase E1 component alpha subunit
MLSKEDLILFEEKMSKLYERGKIRAPVHLIKGNEDQLLKIFNDVNEGDWVFSTWRNHYHALLKGISPETLEKEIVSGHSMHINSKSHNFYSSSIVGGSIPVALGVAMALKKSNSKNKVWSFSGDMGSETGIFHEATKYALGHNLPINFIVEDDGLGVYTPTKKVWGESIFTKGNSQLKKFSGSKRKQKQNENTSIQKYEYKREWPSHGIGLWVEFPDDKESKLEFLAKGGENYDNELKRAMEILGKNEKVVFLGQTVGYKGSPIYNSLENVSMGKRIELPVMEETQMGMSIGLALAGYIPVSIYPRFDFLTLATNQLVNHLDKAYELSNGEFNPKVIVRTSVGSKTPLYPGPQHCQDHTEAYKLMLKNMDVIKLKNHSQIVEEYERAIEKDRSTLMIEI